MKVNGPYQENKGFVRETSPLMLGHKRIENTMKYIGLMPDFKEQEFEIVTATTDEEIKKAGEAGFTKYDERKIGETCVSYYRRPKRFSPV